MPAILSPELCPNCQQPLQLAYEQRRNGRRRLRAKVMLAGIVLAVVILLVVAFYGIWHWVASLDLRRREGGLLFFLACAICAAAIILVARRLWRYALDLPRTALAGCPSCSWQGPILFREFLLQDAMAELMEKKPQKSSAGRHRPELTEEERALASEHEWTDEDFLPREEPHPIEELRHFIRKRLQEGAMPPAIEEELVHQGHDLGYAVGLVRSVMSTGQPQDVVKEERVSFGNLPSISYSDPTAAKKLRRQRRQYLDTRKAQDEAAPPPSDGTEPGEDPPPA